MEGSSSNAAPRRGQANQALLSMKLGDRRVSSCLTAQPHEAAPPHGAHEGVPRGGAADGGGVACVAPGVEGAAGNAEAPGAKRPRGANDSDSSTRDGLDVEQSVGADIAEQPVRANVADQDAEREDGGDAEEVRLANVRAFGAELLLRSHCRSTPPDSRFPTTELTTLQILPC